MSLSKKDKEILKASQDRHDRNAKMWALAMGAAACPNPKCRFPNPKLINAFTNHKPEHIPGDIAYHVECSKCYLSGPPAETDFEAISLWNGLLRRHETE